MQISSERKQTWLPRREHMCWPWPNCFVLSHGAACLCCCVKLCPSLRFSASRTLGRRHFRCREESRRPRPCQSCHLVTGPRQWRCRRPNCLRAYWITKSRTVLKLVSLLVGVPRCMLTHSRCCSAFSACRRKLLKHFNIELFLVLCELYCIGKCVCYWIHESL